MKNTEKIVLVFLASLRSLLQSAFRFSSLSSTGRASRLKFTAVLGQGGWLRKKLKEFEDLYKKLIQKAHTDFNDGLLPQLILDFRRGIVRPVLSFSSILHIFQKLKLNFKKLIGYHMPETTMEVLSPVKIIGMSQCKYSVSFKGDCHKYALFCSKCHRKLHRDDHGLMDLHQNAPIIILDHYGLGASSWSTDVIDKL